LLAPLGLPPAVLVYNTPLPPLDVDVLPADGAATVTWSPPADDRGAEVEEYVVRDVASGATAVADAGTRSVVVPGLQNGVRHSFVVRAVNRAGESDPSATVTATPQAGLGRAVPVSRLQGTDRISTAVAVSRAGFGDGAAGAVVLSRSDQHADALAGTALAVSRRAPLLITPTAALDGRVLAEVRRVLPRGGVVHLLGGERALSPAVAGALQREGWTVVRTGGADRYATAVAVSERVTPTRPSCCSRPAGRSPTR
jgi:hypothetical protein